MARVEKGINDLATLKPELVEEWDFERNGIDLPEHFTCGSGKEG